MSGLPETRSGGRRKDSSGPPFTVTLALALALAALVIVVIAGGSAGPGFSPGEEVYAPGVEEVAAFAGDARSPGTDASRFGSNTREVRVRLRLEDFARPAEFAATVERSNRTSALSWLFGSGGLAVSNAREERLPVSGAGVSGVVEFAVRARGGGSLPPGEYTVGVRAGEGESAGMVARKYFVVGDRQD